MKDLKPNWPAMTKNQQREKSLKKKQTNETVASGEKRKQQKQNNADISPVYKQGVFSTKDTQEEQDKKKQDKTKNQ